MSATMTIQHPAIRLHLVSETVTSQFCDGRGLMMRLNVLHPDTPPKLKSPAGVAYTTELKPVNPIEFEELWHPMENRFPDAVAAVKDRTILDRPDLLNVLRDCVAVHLARSNTMDRVARAALEFSATRIIGRIANDPRLASPAGLIPGGPESRVCIAEMRVADAAESNRLRDEANTPNSMMRQYGQMVAWLERQPVEIHVAGDGEFMIGDTPAHTHDPVKGLDVPLFEASTVFMPISRHYVVAFGAVTKYQELDRRGVEWVNLHQVRSARNMVMWHPDADLAAFARDALRPQQ